MRTELFFSGVLLAITVADFSPAHGHCQGQVPEVEMTYPSDGVAVQAAVYFGFEGVYVDTFYRDTLLHELIAKFRDSNHVVFGYVDSVRNYHTYDTSYWNNQIDWIDTFSTEDIKVSIHTELKGNMPSHRLDLAYKWKKIPDLPFAYSSMGLIDTPFVTFFNTYDSLLDVGIGPVDGCFFEPQGYFIIADRIHKKGLPSDRMPGVSVSMDEFFAAVGMPKVAWPQIRPHRGIKVTPKPRGNLTLIPGPGPYRISMHDLSGRRLPGFPIGHTEKFPEITRLPMGWYFLRIVGKGWTNTNGFFFPGGTGTADALGISHLFRDQ